MEGVHGTGNINNKYTNDNLLHFQLGIKSKKLQQIDKEWSNGLMEGLSCQHVEAFDIDYPKRKWKEIEIHLCKKKQDLRFYMPEKPNLALIRYGTFR